MNLNVESTHGFSLKIPIYFEVGRFLIKTVSSLEDLTSAFSLRYQIFQVEMLGAEKKIGQDRDAFDSVSDHLAIFDKKNGHMIATCRLNCSLFSNQFYSAQEFSCEELIFSPGTKLEIGRVCVHPDYRRGHIVMILWRALANYMKKTDSQILFGCGSVMTEDPIMAVRLYQYLQEENKVRAQYNIKPRGRYHSKEFDLICSKVKDPLTQEQKFEAQSLLPSLCKSYFDIGCFTPGPPAFDSEFKCIDFLTILDKQDLDVRIRQKMFGDT